MAEKDISNRPNSAVHLPDEELIKLILSDRNSETYGILYDRYAQKVYQRCLKFIDQKEEAQDLTHDLFIKIYYQLPKFQFRSSFSTWLYAITYHHCMEHLKKKNKLKIQQEVGILESTPDPIQREIEDLEFLSLKAENLKLAMDRIPVEDRMILYMKYLDESSIKDICTVLKLSESAVKMRILRAKNRVVQEYNKFVPWKILFRKYWKMNNCLK